MRKYIIHNSKREVIILAEKINKPKFFTNEWFRYIWDYYKIHIFVLLGVIVLAVITVVEVSDTVKYDGNINYIVTNADFADVSDKLAHELSENTQDINNDGEKHISLTELNFSYEATQNYEQSMAMETKLMATLASKDEMLFIFDEYMLKYVLDMSATEGIFVPVEHWLESEVDEDELYEYAGGVYAISLKDSHFFKEQGIDASDMYMVVKENYEPDNKLLQEKFANYAKLANLLIK